MHSAGEREGDALASFVLLNAQCIEGGRATHARTSTAGTANHEQVDTASTAEEIVANIRARGTCTRNP